tara:strand:- start:601 stop:804 length:204 start_codon:yes stop_codon:yes gene_type:complete
MTSYSTTLLPPSPLYKDPVVMIASLCDRALKLLEEGIVPADEVDQHFEISMRLLDFWGDELGMEIFS